MKVTLVGVGPGNPELLTGEAREAIRRADLLVGAPRLLEPFRELGKSCRELMEAGAIRDFLKAENQSGREAAVLLSGDVGFYSGAKRLLPLLEGAGMQVRCLCGVSSLQYLCARLGRPWEEVYPASAHGRACDPAALVREHGTVFFLTGEKGSQTPGAICQALAGAGLGKTAVWVGSRLSYPDEGIAAGRAEEFARMSFPPLSALLAQGEAPGPEGPAPWPYRNAGIPDGEFLRGKTPMTKQEVRAAALAKLGVASRDTLWDVGAGTGSVSVELALLAPEGRVYAVERDPEAAILIGENAEKFQVQNLVLVEGEAPAALMDLPAPNAVFVGGSGGEVREILSRALQKNPRVRAVVSAISLETLAQAAAALGELSFEGVEVSQISVARSKAVGSCHLMLGQNPVFLLRGVGKGEKP